MNPTTSRHEPLPEFINSRQESNRATRHENLALLYQGVLTGVVRLQAGRHKPRLAAHRPSAREQELPVDLGKFRQRMLTALRDIARQAKSVGYSPEDIRDAEFATVAFLDEVVLSVADPIQGAEWKQQTLAVELYQEARAGEVFFEKLESTMKSRRDSSHLADVLEVYLLCLLLGFEGRYADLKGELHSTADRVKRSIDGIRRPDLRLAPSVIAEAQLVPPTLKPTRLADLLQRWAPLAILAAAVLVFLLLKLHLSSTADRWLSTIRT